MGYVLTIYSETVYQEFILPVINNADYTITLPGNIFALREDMKINLEVSENQWRFVAGKGYKVQKDGKDFLRKNLQEQEILTLTLLTAASPMNFGVLIRKRENALFVYQKFLLPLGGQIGIGKNPQNQICYDAMKRVSGSHAVIEVGSNRCVLHDLSKNGVYVNHMRVQQNYVLRYGDTINIVGLKIVFLGSFLAIDTQMPGLKISTDILYPLRSDEIADAVLVNAPDKKEETEKKYFNRIPRSLEQINPDPFAIEPPPGKDNTRKNPWYLTVGPSITMAIPMSLGCVMSIVGSGSSSVFMYTGLVTAFGSAIIGATWGAVRIRHDKKRRREDEAHRLEAYGEYLNESEEEIRTRYEEDERILRNRYDAADYLCAQGGAYAQLWSRNTTHPDFLYHRLGLGSLPFPSEVAVPQKKFMLYKDELAERPRQIKEKYEKLQQVPVGVDLLQHSLIGIVGGYKKLGAYEVLKCLLVQIAANNCYTDVKLALTYDEQKMEQKQIFEMFRWLPHTWSQDKQTRYMAGNPAEISDVYYALTQIFRQRSEEEPARDAGIPKPVYVLVVGNLESLNNELISKYIFDSRSYGLITILLVEDYEDLPNECEYIISNRGVPGSFTGAYSVRGEEEERREITFDLVANQSVEYFARSLSNIEVEELETGGDIPSSITFFEMLGISNLSELDVRNRWMKNRTYDTMRALLGQKAGGAPCYLDVHEKYHGPHGLVAGTTGSGKSETLQTYMLSLAINYSPDDIGFFIIDYKGGGMANLFNGLPHLMGQISNLSGNQVHRAMVSIKSENRRRQRVFNESGVNNINSYTKLYKNNEVHEPVPHLFIIIDEFAELKREEPDFMRELISVAQVGRSLGVHLILATQKPSGTVDDNIWSNSKFRLCLRVQDRQDSSDMLHKPDAAYITQAGRGYLQVGNDELYELFQSGYSGAAYDESGSEGKNEAVKMYTMHGRTAIVGNRLKMYRQEKAREQWLQQLVKAAEELFSAQHVSAGMTMSSGNGANSHVQSVPPQNSSMESLVKTPGSAELANQAGGTEPGITDTRAASVQIIKSAAVRQRYAESLGKLLESRGIDCPASGSNLQRLENLVLLCAEAAGKTTDGKVYYILNESVRRNLKLPETKEKTQLDAVVAYLAEVAAQNGYNRQFLLWLPVLPEALYLNQLSGFTETSFANGSWPRPQPWELKACIGLCDDPANQAQMTLELDFGLNGHLLVFGSVGTGRSTFLQTLAYSLIHRYSPEYVNLYCMDFSSNSLRAFEKSAHVGGVMYENDLEEISRCFNMLESMLRERKVQLKGGNYEQYVQTNGVKLPAVFLLIDNYANFRDKTGNRYEELMIRLSRDAAACGIYLVISAAGFGLTELSNNIGKNIKTTITLELGDKFQYADLLHTTRIPVLPEAGVKGRGLVRRGEQVLEYQTALALEAEDDYARIERIAAECERLNAAWKGKKAKPVPCIPEQPVIRDLYELEEVQELLKDNHSLPVGYNVENAEPYCIDLRNTFSYLISGKAKSGKKNLLKVLLAMAVKKEIEVLVVDFSGKLRAAAEEYQVSYIHTDRELYDTFVTMQPKIIEKNKKKKELEGAGASDRTIYNEMCRIGQVIILIENLADFVTHASRPEKGVPEMAGFLANITEKGAGLGMYFFCAYNPVEVKKAAGNQIYNNLTAKKEGMHFGGNSSGQTILNFTYVPFKEQGKALKPGIAMLPLVEGEAPVKRVIIPAEKREEAEEA